MMKVIITKGLPASGKTTWAKEYQKKNPNTILVCKDDLRSMLHQSVHSKSRESFVLEIRDLIINIALIKGQSVVVHDTNLNPIHEKQIRSIVDTHNRILISSLNEKPNVVFEIQDFTNVSVEECIKNDQKRSNYVGEKVIRQMYNQYLKPKVRKIEYEVGLPNAIMCDIDGTLALFGDANPYDRDFLEDVLNTPVANILLANKDTFNQTTILLSGRNEKYRKQTEKWLKKHHINYDGLFMRAENDVRKDFIVKKEIYEKYIKGKYNVIYVLDDRNQVVELWRSLGLTCLQVAEGNF